MQTSQTYTDRLFSLSITGVIEPKNQDISLKFANRSVTGIQRILEQYVVLLLDVLGSNQYQPAQGTELVSSLLTGSVVAQSEAQHVLNFANAAVERAMQDSESDATPDDERIKRTTLTLNAAQGDALTFTIQIETLAGTSLKFVLPASMAIK